MIILQTPGTGLDDFETRIALGMCRVALDCVEPDKVWLKEKFDRFLVYIDIEKENLLSESLKVWCIKVLSDESLWRNLPGRHPRYIKEHSRTTAEFGIKAREEELRIINLYNSNQTSFSRKGAQNSSCGHQDKGMFGALLTFSPQLGQPPKRNNPKHQITLPLCPFCGALALLGTWSFQINLKIKGRKERFLFMPRFRGRRSGEDLLSYIAATKHIDPWIDDIPTDSALLTLLGLYPHISRLKAPDSFFVAQEEYFGNRPSRYQNFMEEEARLELDFLARSSYNVALVQESYRKSGDKPELIRLLSKTLKQRLPRDAISFYREYASASEGKRLVYRDSTNFIAKEVLEMDEGLIDDPNIGAIASMLKFFVRKQKFGYVDNLRGSRTADEFEKHLLSAQKDASSIYAREGGEKEIFLPSETNVREFLRILQKDGNFEKVRTLVCLLAFTYWKKEVE